MKKLLIATHNPAKLAEIKHFLTGLSIKLVSLKEMGIKEDVEEDGETFAENAIKKAKYYAAKSGLATLADDGGLEIDYLNGGPGVHSRRWITGHRANDEELINYTLKLLKGVSEEKRGAQLRAVLALAFLNDQVKTAEGKIRGIIANKPYIKKRWVGFPFRALFYLPKIKKYYNPDELTAEEERKYNHRLKALEKLKKSLLYTEGIMTKSWQPEQNSNHS